MSEVKWIENRPKAEKYTPVTAEDARAAARFWRGAPFYAPTPLRRLDRTAAELGLGAAYLKDEGLRAPLGAFKLLGAGYAMARALCGDGDLSWEKAAESGKKAVFYTATDGNHGRAVAYMARAFGCRAVVLMPAGASRERFETIAAEGAEVTVEDANYDECVRRARALADENGGVLLQDTTLDNYEALPHEIMRGYAAIAAEVFEEMPEPPTHIILQAGVGAFAGAMASAFAELWPGADICFIVCEAAAAPCLMLSAAAGERRIVTGALGTIMAGLACGEPCDIGLASLLSRARIFAALPDACAAEAMRALAAGGVVAGESGAAGMGLLREAMLRPALAGLREAAGLNEHSRVLVFNTETATDAENYRAIVGTSAGQATSFEV